jgi:hypothetical protein
VTVICNQKTCPYLLWYCLPGCDGM